MGGQRLGERLPLVEEPRHLLFRLLPLERDGPDALAVGVERRIGQRPPQILEPGLDRVNLGLEGVETPPALAHGGIDPRTAAGPPDRRSRVVRRRRARSRWPAVSPARGAGGSAGGAVAPAGTRSSAA